MTPDEFANRLSQLESDLVDDSSQEIGRILETEALSFIDENFRNQGWEGSGWQPSKGTILVKSGRLRAGFETTLEAFGVRVVNRVPYAQVHNEGLSGVSEVVEHSRAVKKGSAKKGKITVLKTIAGHSRAYNYPQRQFAPITGTDSPTLNERVVERLDQYIASTMAKNKLT